MEDLRRRGFSVQRTTLYGYQDAVQEIRKRDQASGGDICCAGFVVAAWSQVASISHEGAPAFRIEPDGHLEDRHDAHVSITFMSNVAKQVEKKLRMLLRDAFSLSEPVDSLGG
jgi:hypothetical protein